MNLRAWYVDKTNFCLLKSQLWQFIFCFSPTQVNQFGTPDSVNDDTLENSALWLTVNSIFCCTQRQEWGQTAPCQSKWLMMGRVINFMGCSLLRKPDCLFFASKLFVLETKVKVRCEFLPRDAFSYFAGFVEQIYYAFAKKLDKLFWTTLKEIICVKLIGTLGGNR